MQNLLPCRQNEHSARTITGAVTGLQPSRLSFVTRRGESKNAIDFLLARGPAPALTGIYLRLKESRDEEPADRRAGRYRPRHMCLRQPGWRRRATGHRARPGRPYGHRAPPPSSPPQGGRHGRRSGPAAGPAGSPAATAPAAPPAPPPAAPCLSRYLGASAGIGQGTPGSSYVVIDFKNLDNSPCTLYGYPGISLVNGKPVTQIGQAAAENRPTRRCPSICTSPRRPARSRSSC